MRAFIAELFADRTLRRILLVGIAFHALAAWRTYGFYSWDEHFQLLEFAAMKLGLVAPENLAWEFHERVRSAVQPAIAYGVIGTLREIGVLNPFTQATVLRFLSAAVSLTALLALLQTYFRDMPSRRMQHWLLGLGLLLWFVPFLNVRYSSETWSAALMLAGLALINRAPRKGLLLRSAALLGAILGLAFLFRYQTALMAVGALAWLFLVRRERPAALAALLAAGAAVVAIGMAIDRWLYGEWTFAPWNYLHANLVEGKAASFGTSPWWDYFRLVLEGATYPIGALIILSFLAFWVLYPRSILTWVTLPFFVVHLAIPHKELRFLFPMADLSGIVLMLTVAKLHERRIPERLGLAGGRTRAWLTAAFLFVNAPALVAASALPATYMLNPARYIYEHYRERPTVVLYPEGELSPYGLEQKPKLFFYKPDTVSVQSIEATSGIEHYLEDGSRILVFLMHKEPSPPPELESPAADCQIVRRTPQWIVENLNVGGWVQEIGFPVLYECAPRAPG